MWIGGGIWNFVLSISNVRASRKAGGDLIHPLPPQFTHEETEAQGEMGVCPGLYIWYSDPLVNIQILWHQEDQLPPSLCLHQTVLLLLETLGAQHLSQNGFQSRCSGHWSEINLFTLLVHFAFDSKQHDGASAWCSRLGSEWLVSNLQ